MLVLTGTDFTEHVLHVRHIHNPTEGIPSQPQDGQWQNPGLPEPRFLTPSCVLGHSVLQSQEWGSVLIRSRI